MRQSTMVGISCLLCSIVAAFGAIVEAGWFRGAILILLGGLVATTFAITVDLREREERDAERWPPREGLSR